MAGGNDDKTLRDFYFAADRRHGFGEINLTWLGDDGQVQNAVFARPVRIGRSRACDVVLNDPRVSKQQAELFYDGRRWCVRDLGSTHGTYLNGVRVEQAPLPVKSTLQVHIGGPVVEIEVEGAIAQDALGPSSVTQAIRHYFTDTMSGAGPRTRIMRLAFQRVRTLQKRRYVAIIGATAVLLLIAVAYGLYQKRELQKARALYIELFYQMNELKLTIATLNEQINATGEVQFHQEVGARRERLRRMEEQYDAFLGQIALGGRLDQEERIIFRVARMFGECELNMPEDFVAEVREYIRRWRSTPKMARAMKRLQPDLHVPVVFREMLDNHLPPQFLYVALQESAFDLRAVGPRTKYGIAKGMWQFMPDTARQYGLRTGPLVEMSLYDPADQRFDFEASTRAAGRYLHDIYYSDAQASGLLVLASYNWGPGNIRRLIRKMPADPRERNFWKLLSKHSIPKQTYDYVFYIIAAIVIGENPQLFGFDFENPLEGVAAPSAATDGGGADTGGPAAIDAGEPTGIAPVAAGHDAGHDAGLRRSVSRRRPAARRADPQVQGRPIDVEPETIDAATTPPREDGGA